MYNNEYVYYKEYWLKVKCVLPHFAHCTLHKERSIDTKHRHISGLRWIDMFSVRWFWSVSFNSVRSDDYEIQHRKLRCTGCTANEDRLSHSQDSLSIRETKKKKEKKNVCLVFNTCVIYFLSSSLPSSWNVNW